LVFGEEHGDLAGLEVRMKRISIDQMMEVSRLLSLRGKGDNELTGEDRAQINELFDLVGGRMVSWNLEEEDGTPVACTAAALRDQDPALVYGIISGWMDALAGVSAPLAKTSSGGDLSMEESIPVLESPPLSLAS
jgi:hypothetical protein